MTGVWRYKRNGEVLKEFATKDELKAYLKGMDGWAEYNIRYWYVENYFAPDDLIEMVAEGRFENVSADDILDDALDQIETDFSEGNYDWNEDDVFGVCYKDDTDW